MKNKKKGQSAWEKTHKRLKTVFLPPCSICMCMRHVLLTGHPLSWWWCFRHMSALAPGWHGPGLSLGPVWSALLQPLSGPYCVSAYKDIKRMIYWAWVDNAFKNVLLLVFHVKTKDILSFTLLCINEKKNPKLPEIFKVLLDVGEQRVLQCLNMLSVYVLWDQFCPPPVCKHKQKHTNIQYTASRDYRWDVRQHSSMYCHR